MSTEVIWSPSHPERSRLHHFMAWVGEQENTSWSDYNHFHRWSIEHADIFWAAIASYFKVQFTTPPRTILNTYQHPLDAVWFEGAMLNFAAHFLRRNDDHPAIISYLENGERRSLNYQQLHQQVAACIQGLKNLNIGINDRVAAIMPNTPETIIAMLATTAIGAIWASCSTDFGADAAIDRLGQIEPKVLFVTQEHAYAGKHFCNHDKIIAVQNAIPSLQQTVICSLTGPLQSSSTIPRSIAWEDFLDSSISSCTFTPLPFSHPVYILFSSGTTGKPKCIVHSAGGTLLQHLKELALHSDMDVNDNLCFFTTCGWMMWNWMVSALSLGATITLYEGSPVYPNAYHLFKILDTEEVSVFGTSAKFISTLEKSDTNPRSLFQLTALKTILSTGSPLLPSQYDFILQSIKPHIQISSISGGTDIVSCFALGNPLLPVHRGELQCLGLGMDVAVWDEHGHSVIEQRGELVCTNAFPAMPIYFWNDPKKKRYYNAYYTRFPGVWTHGDFAELTGHHGLIIYGRSDTVLNPGGVRIGTAEIYRQIERISQIEDSVVVGQDWDNDIRIVLFVKLKEGLQLDEKLIHTIKQTIREHASPRHVPAIILAVPDIPKTINGKVVELAVRQIIHHQPITNIQSLANPESLYHFKNCLTVLT